MPPRVVAWIAGIFAGLVLLAGLACAVLALWFMFWARDVREDQTAKIAPYARRAFRCEAALWEFPPGSGKLMVEEEDRPWFRRNPASDAQSRPQTRPARQEGQAVIEPGISFRIVALHREGDNISGHSYNLTITVLEGPFHGRTFRLWASYLFASGDPGPWKLEDYVKPATGH